MFIMILVPSSITVFPNSSTVIEGFNLILECHASGNPVPNITWTKDGTVWSGLLSIDTSSFPITVESVLNISSVHRSDNGIYQCVAQNGVGNQVTNQATITVWCKYIMVYINLNFC